MNQELQNQKVDIIVSTLKASFGYVPLAGGILAEVIGNIIPNQRIDRIANLVGILTEKVKDIEEDIIKQKMQLSEYVDLFEDCCWAVSRALTVERKEHIANVFVNGLKDEEVNLSNHKRILNILNQLDDIDLIFIKYYILSTWMHNEAREYFYLHEEILTEKKVYLGAGAEQHYDREYYLMHKRHIYSLGLIEHDKDATQVEQNEFKKLKATWLSVLVLNEIGQLPEDFPYK